MNISQFLQFFVLFVALGSLAVTGWFFITRGDEEELPDGSIKRTGKLFKGWYFYWTQPKRTKEGVKVEEKIYYYGEALYQLVNNIQSNNPRIVILKDDNGCYIYNDGSIKDAEFKKMVSDVNIKFGIELNVRSGLYIHPYIVVKKYRFPEWVRMPLAQCSTCFSSLYGTTFYVAGISLAKEKLFAWSDHPIFAGIFFWGVFCFCLSVLNTALAKKFN